MRDILLASCPYMLWVITAIHVVFMVLIVKRYLKSKNILLFLSGFLMFLFSALGPATGNFDLIFYISMYGEVLMALYFYLYAVKKEKM